MMSLSIEEVAALYRTSADEVKRLLSTGTGILTGEPDPIVYDLLKEKYWVDISSLFARIPPRPPKLKKTATPDTPKAPYWGLVYLVNAIGTTRYKIGFAIKPEKRLSELGTASPFPLKLIKTVKGTLQTETELHRAFANARVNREWFEFSELGPVIEEMDRIARLHG